MFSHEGTSRTKDFSRNWLRNFLYSECCTEWTFLRHRFWLNISGHSSWNVYRNQRRVSWATEFVFLIYYIGGEVFVYFTRGCACVAMFVMLFASYVRFVDTSLKLDTHSRESE